MLGLAFSEILRGAVCPRSQAGPYGLGPARDRYNIRVHLVPTFDWIWMSISKLASQQRYLGAMVGVGGDALDLVI
jgi:hypothetical protein